MLKNARGREFVRIRQREAPLLEERERYLSHLLDRGTSKRFVRVVASRLLHINRLLGLTALRPVDRSEVQCATQRWIEYIESHPTRVVGVSTAYTFRNTAENWLRFYNLLVMPVLPARPFDAVHSQFMHYIKVTRQMSSETVLKHRKIVSLFLSWAGERHDQINNISLNCIDEYLDRKRSAGMKPRSIASYCVSLRTFFRYAEGQGWCETKIARGIKSPLVPRYDVLPKGPRWKDVRRLLEPTTRDTPADMRTSAILFLCSIYALRSKEIRGLTIHSFNWIRETFTVQRAKGGRIQELPIQYEVGEAILRYLRKGRPSCSCRELFVTLKPPYQPMHQCVLSKIVRRRMESLKIESVHYGPHALRHACATELLRQGSSLIEIADFLGHRDIRSVSIYAKLDVRSLRLVAAFSLAGVK
jgi:integrase/recombinase XerD